MAVIGPDRVAAVAVQAARQDGDLASADREDRVPVGADRGTGDRDDGQRGCRGKVGHVCDRERDEGPVWGHARLRAGMRRLREPDWRGVRVDVLQEDVVHDRVIGVGLALGHEDDPAAVGMPAELGIIVPAGTDMPRFRADAAGLTGRHYVGLAGPVHGPADAVLAVAQRRDPQWWSPALGELPPGAVGRFARDEQQPVADRGPRQLFDRIRPARYDRAEGAVIDAVGPDAPAVLVVPGRRQVVPGRGPGGKYLAAVRSRR